MHVNDLFQKKTRIQKLLYLNALIVKSLCAGLQVIQYFPIGNVIIATNHLNTMCGQKHFTMKRTLSNDKVLY